jgi:hypothetical protein
MTRDVAALDAWTPVHAAFGAALAAATEVSFGMAAVLTFGFELAERPVAQRLLPDSPFVAEESSANQLVDVATTLAAFGITRAIIKNRERRG